MTYLAAQFALYLLGACAIGVVVGWSLRARREPRTGTSRAAITPAVTDRHDRQVRGSTPQAPVVPPSPAPVPTLPSMIAAPAAPVLPPPPPVVTAPTAAAPVAAAPVGAAPVAAAPVAAAPADEHNDEVVRLRRTLERLQTKLTVLETAAATSPMTAHDAQQTRLVEQIEQQRQALAAQSMELAVLRARYEGARTELDRLGRVGLGLGHGA